MTSLNLELRSFAATFRFTTVRPPLVPEQPVGDMSDPCRVTVQP